MPDWTPLQTTWEQVERWLELRAGQRAPINPIIKDLEKSLSGALRRLEKQPANPRVEASEPDDLQAIRALRPKGERILSTGMSRKELKNRILGAWLGRAAGCTLGVPVEAWSLGQMEGLAACNGDAFPPRDYWTKHPGADAVHYGTSVKGDYLRGRVRHVPVDDDLAYTLLGLLILEQYGPEFTTGNVGEAWLRYLPEACTAERVTLENLRKGISAERAGALGNPYSEWIGADIRSDPWGYAAPGQPERAATMAYRDAMLSHRKTGVYGAMFFSAAIAAAFATGDPLQALHAGLNEIPRRSRLAKAIRWAFDVAPAIHDWRAARALVDERFPGMHVVHTINNACLTIFGLHLGGQDFTRVIGETVAMGLDNDCTAATAGSIFGAAYGTAAIPEHWWKPFRNRTRTYLIEQEWWRNSEIAERFTAIAWEHAPWD